MPEALDRYYSVIASKQVGDMQEVNRVIEKYEAQYGDMEEVHPIIVNRMIDEIEKI